MRKTVAAVLFAALLAPGCKGSQRDKGGSVDLVSLESISMRSSSTDDPPPEEEDKPDDGESESGRMALNEGAAGSPGAHRAEGQYKMQAQKGLELPFARQQAIEQARAGGVLGSRTGTGDVSSGFDTANIYGGVPGSAPGKADVATGEDYKDWGRNIWTDATKDRLSTFAADVDTASYTIARRKLEAGALPPKASVRVEEFVNYFKYGFPAPTGNTPFAVVMEAAPSPLQAGRHIVRVGVATKAKSTLERKPAHLVFLVDVSGSMSGENRIGLAKQSLRILTQNLTESDTVSVVTYAGSTRVVLKPTSAQHKDKILAAIEELQSGGSTGMASGIDLAYQQAKASLKPGHISRVIILSDGDANVGPHTHEELQKIISGRAKEGVTLSTIGFGMGNYKDTLMEQLANKGNGNNFYIDTLDAAKKVFQEQLTANLEVVAKDVKLQVDFDPAMVARYRLVGYENRNIKDEDFREDNVDAGEIGAGHQVTALYEIELTAKGKQTNAPIGGIRIRHKQPEGTKATEAAFPMVGGAAASFANSSTDFRFAFAVAAFADVLRGGQDAEHWSLKTIRDMAKNAAGSDTERKQLVTLIDKAIEISGRSASRTP